MPSPQRIEVSRDIEKAAEIRRLCWLAKMRAQAEPQRHGFGIENGSLSENQYKPLLGHAIVLTRQLRDPFCRASALQQLIVVLMAAGEEQHARTLFRVVEFEPVRESILAEFPILAEL